MALLRYAAKVDVCCHLATLFTNGNSWSQIIIYGHTWSHREHIRSTQELAGEECDAVECFCQCGRIGVPGMLSSVVMGFRFYRFYCWAKKALKYRVTIQVGPKLPLTSKQKFRFGLTRPGQARPGQSGTIVLKSTGGSVLPEWSPCNCSEIARHH